MRKASLFFSVLSILTVFASLILRCGAIQIIYAQYGVVPYGQYAGAAVVQGISVSKMVSVPGSGGTQFVDNLSASDAHFKPGDTVTFKIIVQNVSTTKLTNVTIKDFVPDFVEPIDGPGTFDSSTRTFSFSGGDFNSGEQKVFFINTQVVSQNQLPADKSLICVINKVQAFTGNVFGESASQFCIEKQIVGAAAPTLQAPQQVPAAGPSLGLLFLGINVITIIIGISLHNKRFPH